MKERRKIEVKKKKIRRCIFALWCILAIIFLIAVNIYNGNEKAENVIVDGNFRWQYKDFVACL